jgi:hypothetical protein
MDLGDAGLASVASGLAPPMERASPKRFEEYASSMEDSKSLFGGAEGRSEPIDALDPGAALQTGPGIPDWRWNSVELSWTGPVGAAESARVWLITPPWRLGLSLLGAALVLLLGLRLAGLIRPRGSPPALLVILLVCGTGTVLQSGSAGAAEIPGAELLETLRSRLLAPPECLPACVDLPRLAVFADPGEVTLELTLDAAVAAAAPLPGGAGGWTPTNIRVDGQPAEAVRRDADGRLFVALPAGRHQVELAGPPGHPDQMEIPLPLSPRQVQLDLDGWKVEGLDASGRAGAQLRLIRLSERGGEVPAALAQGALPPLLRVERTLRLGIAWRVETRVERLSPLEFPLLIPVPLLSGESVQTAAIQVEGEQVLVDLPAGTASTSWSSRLDPVSELRLSASTDPRLSEDWRLDAGPLWHVETQGIAPVHRVGLEERWLPSWRPLPGEALLIKVARPPGVPGPTLTIDRVALRVEPGQRGTRSTLDLAIRSSQGGSHLVRLAEGAEPIGFKLNGQSVPLPSAAPTVEIPLTPGATEVELIWREPHPLSLAYSPRQTDLAAPVVNLNVSLRLPEDRWVLWTWGPRIGPAVLFWGVLLVLIALAWGLARSRLTPLRFLDWLLLGIGLILAQVWVVVLVTGWLFALGLRRRMDPMASSPWRFNLVQTGLILITLLALGGLISAVQLGLLGTPEMQIMGNGSTATTLNWYQDRGGPGLPSVWVLSVPLWVYRILMLAWALWLAVRLLDWLRWGWEGLSKPVLWRESALADVSGPGRKPASEDSELRLDV